MVGDNLGLGTHRGHINLFLGALKNAIQCVPVPVVSYVYGLAPRFHGANAGSNPAGDAN